MTNNNYISIKVCGNPQGVGGIQTIANFNETERINIPDDPQINAGFCPGNEFSYWFKIKTEAQRTIYSLGTHKVLSGDGSDRGGRLVIAISIPKGNKLGDNKSPYDVLVELKDYFLSKYMTSASNIRGTYFRYSSEPIPTNAFDEIAKSYTLIPHKGPHRPMIGTSIGYVIANNQMIKDLMSDAQYPEFTRFSEVIISNSGQRIGCTPINGLTIPRKPVYKIMEKGTEVGHTSSINAKITITGNQNPNYYDNSSKEFTIAELQSGTTVEGVLGLDYENEIINVDQTVLSKQREMVIHLNVSGDNIKSVTGKDFEVKYGNIPLSVSEDCTFKLVGQQISFLNDTTRFNILCCKKRVGNISVDGTTLRGSVITIMPNIGSSSKGTTSQASNVNIQLFNLLVGEQLFADNTPISLNSVQKEGRVQFKYTIFKVEDNKEVVLQRVDEHIYLTHNAISKKYECLIAVPKQMRDKQIRIVITGYPFESTLRANPSQEVSDVTGFKFKRPAVINGGKWLKFLYIFLFALLLGAAGGGITVHSLMKKRTEAKIKEAEAKVPRFGCGTCKGKFMTQEDLANHATAHIKKEKKAENDATQKQNNQTQKQNNQTQKQNNQTQRQNASKSNASKSNASKSNASNSNALKRGSEEER